MEILEFMNWILGALMIQNAREDDEGKYECVARNQHGVVHSKAAHLYVKGRGFFGGCKNCCKRMPL